LEAASEVGVEGTEAERVGGVGRAELEGTGVGVLDGATTAELDGVGAVGGTKL
jgi:hypothetical protein